ncbi:ABC transporter ATP-binding protein [Salinicola sp. JS01]|uniref:ABC transporter ATP-binding protein n=1 Tax=Salinicola sp. JS01 TaxID=3050071 RepID=UPI00255B8B6D|nr:ABC transporter ATP-binding protein [Salinicola sp. JS01]WIX32327.1 ABC transporter ATP-binding protein [Salinicola sp. JS01]
MSLFERLRALPDECRDALRRASLWAMLAGVLDAVSGVLLVPLIEAWFAAGSVPWHWATALLGATLVQALVQYLALRRGFAAGGALTAGLVRQLIARLPWLAPPALDRVAPAEGLLHGPVMQAMGIPAHLLGPLIGALVTPLGVVLGLFLIDPPIALALLVAGILLGLLLRWSGRRKLAVEDARMAAERDVARQVQAFAEHQPLLRAAQRESRARRGLEAALASLHDTTLGLLRCSLPSGLGFALAVQAVFAGVLLGGAWAVQHQALDGARLVAVLVLLVRFLEPLAQLTHLDQALRGAWQALDTLLRVFVLPPLESPEPGEQPRDASLAATKVSVRLDDGRALLTDIDLKLEPGSLNVVVGPSGAGKSTLLAVLGRLYDADAGRVLLGGVDIRRLSATTLAASRNLVFQDNGLFRGSVAWNLRMAQPGASFEALREAARAVGLLAEIERWPQGWESEVGPGGALLSGGQRQRLCLARGFLSTAPRLLLDEPTASLDAVNEAQVLRSLIALRGRRTLLVVTHRPALACLADQVLVLEQGRLRAKGRPAELLTRDAWYADFAAGTDAKSSQRSRDR